MLFMESVDEEFEQLLEEIPRAMEGTTQRNQQDPPEDTSVAKECNYIARSQSIESSHDILEAFRSKPELGSRKEDSAHSTKTGLSDCIVNRDLRLPLVKVLDAREKYTKFLQREAAAEVSLSAMFTNLNLKGGGCMQPNLPLRHHTDVSSDMPLPVSSTQVPEISSLKSTMRDAKDVSHAISEKNLLGIHKNGGHGHVYGPFYGRSVGLQLGGLLHPQCYDGNTFFHRNVSNLDPGTDCVDRGFGLSAGPNQPFNYQVAVPPSTQARLVPSCFLNGQEGWHLNSRLVANHRAQQEPCKLNLQQEDMNFDPGRGYHPQGFADVQYCNDSPTLTVGRVCGYSCLKDSRTFGPISCGHPFRQRLANSYVDNFCTYCTQDNCSKGYACSSLHNNFGGSVMDMAYQVGSAPLSHGLLKAPTASVLSNEKGQVRILPRKSTRLSSPVERCFPGDNTKIFNEKFESNQHPRPVLKDSFKQGTLMKVALAPHEADCHTEGTHQGRYYSWSSVADIEGCILAVAKDQHGCRFLQRKFDEGSPEDVQKIFKEVLDNVVDLMVDPFGNYLVQKLFEVCTDDQRSDLLQSITNTGGLVNVSLNIHGTRAVQKLVETLKSWEHVAIVTASLRSGVVTLIKDLNGNHVIQRCLQHLSSEHNEFIFEAAARNCVEIATHRHGCCVLQRCLDHSTGPARRKLIWEIASNSLQLAQDSFGNYVVQYILELGLPWAIQEVVNRLVEKNVPLSMQKFSSNVIEKCLRLCGEESKAHIIRELIDSSLLLDLMQDPYANYVIQSALMVSKGALHATIVEAIRPHIPSIRNNPYGKRILSRRNFKKS